MCCSSSDECSVRLMSRNGYRHIYSGLSFLCYHNCLVQLLATGHFSVFCDLFSTLAYWVVIHFLTHLFSFSPTSVTLQPTQTARSLVAEATFPGRCGSLDMICITSPVGDRSCVERKTDSQERPFERGTIWRIPVHTEKKDPLFFQGYYTLMLLLIILGSIS